MKANLLKIKGLYLFIISLVFISCSAEVNDTKTETAPVKDLQIKVESMYLDAFIENYINTLQTDNTKLVDSASCENIAENIELYDKQIFLYHVDQIEKLSGDLNADGKHDYIVSYTASNCWNGIGAGNYLTNIFFILAINDTQEVDELGTLKFKQKFIDAIKKEYVGNYYRKAEKHEAMNYISFKEIRDGKGIGDFAIQQCGATPCVEGKFEYTFSTNNLILKNIKKLHEQ